MAGRCLREPDVVVAATREYKLECDKVEQFVQECCVRGPSFTCRSAVLYERYTAWAAGRNEKVLSVTAFGIDMGKKFEKKNDRGITYFGVRVRTLQDIDPDE
jgi:putative DNA primase/helicase